MPKMQKALRARHYGDEVNRLADLISILELMEPDERFRAFVWCKSRFNKEWPGDMS